jgi:adenylate cyclase
VGRAIAEFLSSPFGPVYEHEIERTASKPVYDLDPYECLLRFYAYARFFDAAGHATSVRCMQRAVVSEPRFATAWSALAVLYLHEHTFGYDPQPDRGPALARALEAVRTALDIDGSGRVAATSIVSVRLAEGDHAGYQQAVERALAIVPSHPAVGLQIGYSLTLAGEWERGAALLDASRPTTPNVPGWVEIGYAFRYLQTQDYDEALEWALRSDAPNWFVAPMTVAAAAALAGRNDIAQREAKRLLELYPDFERVGREQLGRWNMSTPLLTALLDGLRSAGLRIT